MTNPEAEQFAKDWVESFNQREIQKVLLHFAEDVTFTSPRALAFAGSATIASRREVETYWQAALESISSLRFTLERVINDPISRAIVIVYLAEIDGRRTRAAEFYQFDESSRIVRGEAMYGAAVSG
jgi:hypothetical protein